MRLTRAAERNLSHSYIATIPAEDGFTRDVRNIGHWGTGDLEVWVKDKASLAKALPLVARAYEGK